MVWWMDMTDRRTWQIWILISGCISLLIWCFKSLSWEDLACWPFEQLLRPLPQIKNGEWLNCSQRCFVFIITYLKFYIQLQFSLWFTVPLFYLEKCCWNGQEIWLVDRSSKFFNLLPQLKDGESFNCCPRCFVYYHNLPEFWYPTHFSLSFAFPKF